MENGAQCYRRYLSGDDEALTEIIRDYKDGLTLYLCEISGNLFLAEEAMEETFFRIAVKKPRFSEKSAFKTWLYAIGRNAVLDQMRKHRRISDTPPESFTELADTENDPVSEYLKEERALRLHRAMARLHSAYRQVLYLVYFEGMSNGDAAAVMKKSRRQIENLVSRARKALKEELLKEGFPDEIT